MTSFEKYPEYQATKYPWIGDLPNSWNVRRLKEVGRLFGGSGFPHEYQNVQGEELYFYKVGDLSLSENGKTLLASSHTISKETARVLRATIVPKSAIVYAKIGAALLLNRRRMTTAACCIDNNMTAYVTEAEEVIPEWAFYWLSTIDFGEHVNPGAVPSFSEGYQSVLPIPVPPVEEQKVIGRFLDFKTAQIDALIAKKKSLLDKLAEKRTALISHAITKGLDSTVLMKDSEVPWLGKIPAHWDAKRLKFVVSTFGGGTPNTGKPEYWNGDIPWVSPKDMKSDFIEATEDYLTEVGVAESATKIVPVDSVLIVVRSGILRHTIPVARNTVEVALNQDMKALVVNERLRPGFIHWFISGLQEGLLPIWSKQGCTVESIEMDYMSNTLIPLPPIEEQDAILEKILEITSRLDVQAEKVTAVISSLVDYRSSLITHAVTGKIDVRGFEVPQTAEGFAP